MASVKRIFTLAGRNLKEILRDPLSLIFMMALPLLMLVLFYFIFHNLTSQFAIAYLAPGIIVFAQSFLTLFGGLLIALDRSSSFLSRLYVSPARSYEFILGYTLALLPVVLVQTVFFMLVGGILDPGFFSLRMLAAVPAAFVPALFFIACGQLVGSLCSEKAIGGVASIVIMGQSVLSGMWFPIEGMSDTVVKIMDVLPFRNATQMMIRILSGYNDLFADVILPMLIVLGYAAVIFAAAVFVYNKRMKDR